MRITQKGQVTIPEAIRLKYGFLPYTEVDFKEEKGKIYLMISHRKKNRRAQTLLSRLKGSANVRLTTDQILKLTRSEK